MVLPCYYWADKRTFADAAYVVESKQNKKTERKSDSK